jgi:hypothetical protein
MNGSAALTKRLRHWPALMKSTTARDYLDGIPADKFAAVVVPHLEARSWLKGVKRYVSKGRG